MFDAIHIINRRRHWQPTPVLLPGKSHGWRNLVGNLKSIYIYKLYGTYSKNSLNFHIKTKVSIVNIIGKFILWVMFLALLRRSSYPRL